MLCIGLPFPFHLSVSYIGTEAHVSSMGSDKSMWGFFSQNISTDRFTER